MSKLRDRLTNPKDIERYDRNYNSCEVIMTQVELDEELAKARNDGQAFILDKIRAEIENKMNSGQWSEAVIYGMKKTIAVIDKYRGDTDGNS